MTKKPKMKRMTLKMIAREGYRAAESGDSWSCPEDLLAKKLKYLLRRNGWRSR